MNEYEPDLISYYLPSDDELEENYNMAIDDLFTAKECSTCKKYKEEDGYNVNCKSLKVKNGIKICYIWRGLIENRS